jgi:hypothetical protein
LTRGAGKSAKRQESKIFFSGGKTKHSLDVVLAVGQLRTELPDELREPEEIAYKAIIITLDAGQNKVDARKYAYLHDDSQGHESRP